MRNCAREIENERDHIVLSAGDQLSRERSNSEVKSKVGIGGEYGFRFYIVMGYGMGPLIIHGVYIEYVSVYDAGNLFQIRASLQCPGSVYNT